MAIDWSSMAIPGLNEPPSVPKQSEKRPADAPLPETGDARKRVKVEEATHDTLTRESSDVPMKEDPARGFISEEMPMPTPGASDYTALEGLKGNSHDAQDSSTSMTQDTASGETHESVKPKAKVRIIDRGSALQTVEDAEGSAKKKPSVTRGRPKGKGKAGGNIIDEPFPMPDSNMIGPYPTIIGKHYEVQDGRCLKQRYTLAKKCTECITRQAGSICLFAGFRTFIVDDPPGSAITEATPCFFATFTTARAPLQYTSDYNRAFNASDREDLKRTVARVFVPTIDEELEHSSLPRAVRRVNEVGSVGKCDFCMTTFFIGYWFCGECGREYCKDCYEHIKTYLPSRGAPLHNTTPQAAMGDYEKETAEMAASRAFKSASPVMEQDSMGPFYSETGRAQRTVSHPQASQSPKAITPVHTGRLTNVSPYAGADFTALAQTSPHVSIAKGKIVDPGIKRLLTCIQGRLHGIDFLLPVTTHTVQELRELKEAMRECAPGEYGAPVRNPYVLPAELERNPPTAKRVPAESLPYFIIDEKYVSDHLFHQIWREGQTLVVEALDDKLEIEWSPAVFANAFGAVDVEVVDCREGGVGYRMKLRDFFLGFGKPKGADMRILKLKDWPSTDFSTTYPQLYEDYCRAIPVPNVTKKNGVLNFAAHMPRNVNKPDLGPKMYCAHAGQDGPGGMGSTRLHMDVADAVNLMVHASSVNGKLGSALWHIYPAADSDKIREFLYRYLAQQEEQRTGKTVTADDMKRVKDDPIHMQQIYMNSDMRDDLFRETGVRGWKIWQTVGQAVFIPAGCAHQVCNFADCIKVANDFVSQENIDRCWQISSEFRQCTKKRAWRHDILQLKNMMYYTWLACEHKPSPAALTPAAATGGGASIGGVSVSGSLDMLADALAEREDSPPMRALAPLKGRAPADIRPVLQPAASGAQAPRTRPASTLAPPVHPVNTPRPGEPLLTLVDRPEHPTHQMTLAQYMLPIPTSGEPPTIVNAKMDKTEFVYYFGN